MSTLLNVREAREHLYRLVGQLADAPWEAVVITRKGPAREEAVAVVVSPQMWRAVTEQVLAQPALPPEMVAFLEGVLAWQRTVRAGEEHGLPATLQEMLPALDKMGRE